MVQIRAFVYSKLPFLTSPDFDATIDLFAQEVMAMLQNCLKIPTADLFDETAYTFLQLSLISDIVCIKLLGTESVKNLAASSSGTGGKFLKMAKAGSAEAEFEQINNNSKLSLSVDDLIANLRREGLSKAGQFGCWSPMLSDDVIAPLICPPFIVVEQNGTCNP